MNDEPMRQDQSGDGSVMTVEAAWNTGKALADWLPTVGNVVVVAANESELVDAVVEGLRLQGRAVIKLTPADQAAAASRIMNEKLSGGAVVSPEGVVCLDSTGNRIEGDALVDIESLVAAGNFIPADIKGDLI